MNQRTEARMAETPKQSFAFSDAFIRWIVVMTCATLFLVNENHFMPTFLQHVTIPQRELTHPSAIAYGVTTSEAVREYYDQAVNRASSTEYLTALSIYLIFFIIGPTLLFFAWRSYQTSSRGDPRDGASGQRGLFLAFLVGGILTFTVALPAIPKAIIPNSFFDNLQKLETLDEHRDVIERDLLELAYDAYQYSVLPRGLGGGGGSFEGYSIKPASRWGTGNRNAGFSIQALTRTKATFRAGPAYPSGPITVECDSSGRVNLPLNDERDHEQ